MEYSYFNFKSEVQGHTKKILAASSKAYIFQPSLVIGT